VRERRSVWTISLANLLARVPKQVEMVKIDAQGMDLAVVLSGGSDIAQKVCV